MLTSLNNALCGLNSLPVPPAFRCVYQWIRKPLEYSESDECNLSYRQPCRTRLSGSRTSNTSAKVDPQDKRWSGGAKQKELKTYSGETPFRDATAGFPAKLRQRNDCRNSILKTCHYQDQVLLLIGHAARENASTNQERYLVLVSERHQYGIFVVFP